MKALEEKGIGRPSTFASIIDVILNRGYVTKRGQALIPSWLAFSVVRLLEEHFADLVDYDFTAALEDDLDAIARGEQKREDWLKDFYFGSDDQVGLRNIVDNLGEIDARALNSTPIGDVATLRFGKYGPYLEIADADEPRGRAAPRQHPRGPRPRRAHARQGAGAHRRSGRRRSRARREPRQRQARRRQGRPLRTVRPGGRPACGRRGRRGDRRGHRRRRAPKPRRSAARRRKSLRSRAPHRCSSRCRSTRSTSRPRCKLLDLPRVVGIDPESRAEITAQNGRYGPYLKKGTDSRTLASEQQLFDITLDEALAVYAQPKYGARGASSALKEFEADPVSGKPIKLKDGRFGPYVTDGETNATIPRGETAMEVDFERAVQLIADKRAKGPAPKRTTRRTTTRKAPAKK